MSSVGTKPLTGLLFNLDFCLSVGAQTFQNASPDRRGHGWLGANHAVGVDVGGANSIPGLRALWKGLLKSRANAPLAALQPIIVIREGSGGRGMQLRLVAGPLGDAAAAAKLCAVLTENDRDCETTVYDGQRLSLKADEAPAAKPAAPPAPRTKKNAAQKRASVEEPKKPEASGSSSWSSFFGKKN